MKGRHIVIALSLVLALTALAHPVLAGEESGTETLEWLEYVDIEIDATDDVEFRATWDIQVTDGVPVNVFLMPEEGYNDYVDPLKFEFSYYPAHSKNNTESFKRTVTLPENQLYYLVIENGGVSSINTSTVEYEVTWEERSGLFDLGLCWPLAIILAILLAIFGVMAGRKRASAEITKTPTPGEVPEAGTGDVTELSPQPEPPDMPADALRPTGEGMSQLSPQPEPPDMPTTEMRPTVEGATELSPQPEPPGHPAEPRKPVDPGD
ncbi:MAG: hypothetical protein JSW25_08645 [Thermoplasmata archaeon]|nr:MAG: hypothetical protein JSW25_08645 [Thermoplasmata archaeon]